MPRSSPRELDLSRLRAIARLVAAPDAVHPVARSSPSLGDDPGRTHAPWLRMTLRRWMAGVAGLALVLAGVVSVSRFLTDLSVHSDLSFAHSQKAAFHADKEQYQRRWVRISAFDAELFSKDGRTPEEITQLIKAYDPAWAESIGASNNFGYFQMRPRNRPARAAAASRLVTWHAEQAAYHAGLKEKYARAARAPWLPVEPDPPEPE